MLLYFLLLTSIHITLQFKHYFKAIEYVVTSKCSLKRRSFFFKYPPRGISSLLLPLHLCISLWAFSPVFCFVVSTPNIFLPASRHSSAWNAHTTSTCSSQSFSEGVSLRGRFLSGYSTGYPSLSLMVRRTFILAACSLEEGVVVTDQHSETYVILGFNIVLYMVVLTFLGIHFSFNKG